MRALRTSHDYFIYQATQGFDAYAYRQSPSQPVSQLVRSIPSATVASECVPQLHVVVPDETTRRKSSWQAAMQRQVNYGVKGARTDAVVRLEALFGYTMDDLRGHLERQFTRRMGWHNYAGNMPFRSKSCWVIDHVVAKSRFKREEAREAFALSNLRPLWIQDNIRKGIARTHLL